MENTPQLSQDSKNMAMLIWILTIFFMFIPGLVFYLLKKDDAYVQDQAREALNWGLTALFIYIAGWLLVFILIGFLVLLALGVVNLVFCILGAVAASNGQPFRAPFAIRLIK